VVVGFKGEVGEVDEASFDHFACFVFLDFLAPDFG
jgi:hypothetical protein